MKNYFFQEEMDYNKLLDEKIEKAEEEYNQNKPDKLTKPYTKEFLLSFTNLAKAFTMDDAVDNYIES